MSHLSQQGFIVLNSTPLDFIETRCQSTPFLLVAKHNLRDGSDFSVVAPVKLVVQESNEPFYPGQEPKINPTTKETVTHLGAAVYRQTVVTSLSSSLEDTKLTTDRVENAASVSATVFNKATATK